MKPGVPMTFSQQPAYLKAITHRPHRGLLAHYRLSGQAATTPKITRPARGLGVVRKLTAPALAKA
jgi:hypothetical protein